MVYYLPDAADCVLFSLFQSSPGQQKSQVQCCQRWPWQSQYSSHERRLKHLGLLGLAKEREDSYQHQGESSANENKQIQLNWTLEQVFEPPSGGDWGPGMIFQSTQCRQEGKLTFEQFRAVVTQGIVCSTCGLDGLSVLHSCCLSIASLQ